MENNNTKNKEVKSNVTKWYESPVIIVLGVIFLITLYYRTILALILLPLIFSVKKDSRISMILAGIYVVILTFVNISVHSANEISKYGEVISAKLPLIYLGLCIYSIVLLVKAYKAKKLKNIEGNKEAVK